MVSKIALLLVALTQTLSPTNAFVPIVQAAQRPQPNQHSATTSNTRLFESIIEAEDRYFQQAIQSSGSGVLEQPEVIFTVVYNPGTPDEGIHTMKYPRGSDNDVLLAFEGMADCIVFARTIKEDPAFDQEPIPTPTSREMIEQACQGMGMRLEIVPMESNTQW